MSKTLVHPKAIRKQMRTMAESIQEAAGAAREQNIKMRADASFELEGAVAFEEDDLRAIRMGARSLAAGSSPISATIELDSEGEDSRDSQAWVRFSFHLSAEVGGEE